MAGNKRKSGAGEAVLSARGLWENRVQAAHNRQNTFRTDGKNVVDRYRLERANQANFWRDKYNILYSSTETMKPSLYASTPKVEATRRQKDRENDVVLYAVQVMENAGQYAMEEVDFDSVLNNVVEDYLLPGLGVAWVRYEPEFATYSEGDQSYEALSAEGLALDYVYWDDFLSCEGRVWEDKCWIGRRVYFYPEAAERRFGKEKANKLQYSYKAPNTRGDHSGGSTVGQTGQQAIVYELWDKINKEVVWYSPDYDGGLLDRKPDPLRLKQFWPCPKPLRAVSTTSEFTPKAFYSQYKEQAETLDTITQRIRILTNALRVVGVYDSSQAVLEKILQGTENKMVAVENWAQFASNNGINGSIQFLPIKEIAATLAELYKQREIAKNEIYEITGFSDIVRGVSKASETLGAQEIKNQWATGRLRLAQKEVQRFCRDVIRIMVEIICEHFSDESLALYAGFEPPQITPEEQQAAAQYAAQKMAFDQAQQAGQQAEPPQQPPPTKQKQAIDMFRQVASLLRNEKSRCAKVGIETDSTIQPDEAQERKDRLEFLGQIGAFLQQAGPMAMQYPDMRGLLGGIMMFAVRTFRASRPLEKEFEDFTKKLAQQPAMPPPGQDGKSGTDPAAAEAQVKSEEIKAQAAQQQNNSKLEMQKYEADLKAQVERERIQKDHEYRMAQLDIERQKLSIQQNKNMMDASVREHQEQRADTQQDHQQSMDFDNANRADRQLEADQTAAVDNGG